MIIESKDNKIIKYCLKLQDSKFSNQESKALVESPKVIKDIIDNNIPIEYILSTSTAYNKYNNLINFNNYQRFEISDKLANLISDTETTTGIFAVVNTKSDYILPNNKKLLVLDNLQDPSNLGAIFRSAVAFDFNNIVLINCCHPYSMKVTRTSMANNFKCNIWKTNKETFIKYAKDSNLHLISCDMNGNNIKNSRPNFNNFAIIIGNEGQGISKELQSVSNETIKIPMNDCVESLNASVSAGIIMFHYNNIEKEGK